MTDPPKPAPQPTPPREQPPVKPVEAGDIPSGHQETAAHDVRAKIEEAAEGDKGDAPRD